MEETVENTGIITEEKYIDALLGRLRALGSKKEVVLNRKKVLVIDDDEVLRGLNKMHLEEEEGCDVREAGDGVEGLEVLVKMGEEEGEFPGLAFVDKQMPRMEGDVFAQHVHCAAPKIPLVLLTANTGGKCAPYFVAEMGKPFDLDDLSGATKKYAKAAARQLRTR